MSLARYRLSLALEALVWTVAMVWLLFLAWDMMTIFRASRMIAWRDLFEIALLALLVYWPLIRVRIKHGDWMQSWDDVPGATGPAQRQDPRPLPHRGQR